jgi:hypothetical protein
MAISPLQDLPKQARPIRRHQGDEIRPGLGVIVTLQANGAAVALARVEFHNLSRDKENQNEDYPIIL